MFDSQPQVLVAEDNPALSGVLDFSLRRTGYEVLICCNGKKAIEAVGSQRFDIIITDYQMPCANGDEVIRSARSGSPNAETPIILCSAKGLELDADALKRDYNLTAVICKPFSPSEMMELVKSVDARIADRTRACC
jgi:CheY-like chemotaxis protein